MDYARLRAAALQSGEDEEAVTVDTRALIDKVLARYSGEWTTLRELIQNAADAQATTVKIRWETLPSTSVPLPAAPSPSDLLKHTITNHTLRRLVVQNDGQPFTKTDWGRLKRIAEGNPDETKIGAFGVGFYSVFADCEEPFVSSGSEAMAFYWKGNALFTRKLQLPEDQRSSDTAFVLDYRNSTTPVPNLLSVSQFLATSLTFVALQQIEFWIDDWRVLSLHKKTSPSVALPIPGDMDTRTREGLMRVTSVARTSTQIDASFMGAVGWKPQVAPTKTADPLGSEVVSLRSFFYKLTAAGSSQTQLRAKAQREEAAAQAALTEDVTKVHTSSIFLGVTAAAVKTHVSASFSAELERATKKPPPKTTRISILTSSYDETVASEASASSDSISKAADVFASVLPSKKPGGRIFIGFPTMQTTGAGMHISAPSTIPTVEREAIDLNARWVRTWNLETLRASGIIARLAFTNEMGELDVKLKRSLQVPGKITTEHVAKFMPEALHILKTFTFGDSTPSSQVGQIIEESFWTSFKQASIEVYSSRGVLQTSQVRLDSPELAQFIDTVPVVPKQLRESTFVKKLIDFELLRPIDARDVRRELEAKAMNKDQLVCFIKWAGRKSLEGELDPTSRDALLEVAIATIDSNDGQGEVIALAAIKNFMNANKIPLGLPLPPTTIPFAYTNTCTIQELEALGWEPLEMFPWLQFLIHTASSKPDEESILKSPKFATQVLQVLSKNWDTLSNTSKTLVVDLLKNNAVMPTKLGMRKPSDSFFPGVKLFDDLPTLQGCEHVKEKLLLALGVRKTVDLDTIFARLLNPSATGESKWSHMELIKYLASVKDDIPRDDMKKLKESRICPAEAGSKGMEPTKGTAQLYRVSELFEPKDTLRALRLPILQWPGPPGSYRASSAEGRFLSLLGLRPYPSVPELVEMMTSSNTELRQNALTYYVGNHHINSYAQSQPGYDTKKAFLPVEGDTKLLVTPSQCFTNEGASVLGFKILRKDLHAHANKFSVCRDPPMSECVNRLLARPPQDRRTAITLFSYFAERLGELRDSDVARLQDALIVPVTRKQTDASGKPTEKAASAPVSLVTPRTCYLGTSATYGEIFDFVDFGHSANAFLMKCGAKNEPSKPEIARMAVEEPARLLSILQTPERYLSLLKSLADDLATLKKDRELYRKMRSARWLLGSKEISQPTKGALIDVEDDEAPIRQYQLCFPKDIVVLDDIISYRLFKDALIVAPEEETLEDFYLALGAQALGTLIQEEVMIGKHADKQDQAASLRKHVLERAKIFLHEYSNYRRDMIKHDAKWLEKNLQVEMVRSVALRRSLRGHHSSNTQKRSAASGMVKNQWVLYISTDGPVDMYQIGQAICQLLLTRPNQQAYLFFEPFLTLDLLGLRARGYNVDRILRQKAAEARIAEEERRKALEAEQRRIKEEKSAWEAQAAEAARQAPRTSEEDRVKMPGAFVNDSPQAPPPTVSSEVLKLLNQGGPPRRGNFFDSLSKRLGFDKNADEEDADSTQAVTERESHKHVGDSLGSPTERQGQHQQKPNDDGRVTSRAVVQQNLLNAVRATRPHDSNTLFSPPTTNTVKEQATYCDATPATDLVFAAEAANGTKVYIHKSLQDKAGKFLQENQAYISRFSSLLQDVAGVYQLNPQVVHIFYDESGSTIAFNNQGSIFCNFRFFQQLHARTMMRDDAAGVEARIEAASWWWVVIAHELAHNLVGPHNSDHSYYTESFVQQYFGRMVAKMSQWRSAANSSVVVTMNGVESGPSRSSMQPPPPYSDA